jgi:hypothetical protein
LGKTSTGYKMMLKGEMKIPLPKNDDYTGSILCLQNAAISQKQIWKVKNCIQIFIFFQPKNIKFSVHGSTFIRITLYTAKQTLTVCLTVC